MAGPELWHDQAARMVSIQLQQRGIADARVLAAMRHVPRHEFVAPSKRAWAWADEALPIEAGQTISQPYVVARMAELAELGPDDNVLEVGAGTGYAAAVFSRLAKSVVAVERHDELARGARERLARLGYDNIEIVTGDGSLGWPPRAPYTAIIVSAGGSSIPSPLLDQMARGGRLVMPVGHRAEQWLTRVRRTGDKTWDSEEFGRVAFVPLVSGSKGL